MWENMEGTRECHDIDLGGITDLEKKLRDRIKETETSNIRKRGKLSKMEGTILDLL